MALGSRLGLLLLGLSTLLSIAAPARAQPAGCPAALATEPVIAHDFGVSFCELCDVGTVRIDIQNPFEPADDVDFSELVVVENLLASGLTYVPNTTSFTGINVAAPPVVEPVVGGANGSLLTWTIAPAFVLPDRPGAPGNRAVLRIEFDVRRHPAVGQEGLVGANRNIDASVDFLPSCAVPPQRYGRSTGPGTLPLREPIPQITKGGRNVDANQGAGGYSDPVYGHANDDVIWRIEVQNNGLAPLQDFEFDDSIVPGNFDINYVCDTEARATSVATGGSTAGCVSAGGGTVTSLNDFDVRAAFGGAANPYIVAPAGGNGFYYLVGRITNSCRNRVNTVSDVEWGCQAQPPTGGISVSSTGVTAGDTALLSTRSVAAGVDVDVFLTGTTTSQNMGTKGQVRIRIRNQSGGTIKGEAAGLRIRDLLPPEYVIDPTFTPTVTMSPAYGAYPGMVDTVQWTNPAPGTFPLVTTDPARPLSNTTVDLLLTSSTVHPQFADQIHMIRHGDVVNVRFRTILIDPTYYDKTADIDVRVEEPASTPPNTDPTETFAITNRAELWWEEFCTTTLHNRVEVDNDIAEPEDLDVDVVGTGLVFILTNTDPLTLTASLTNRGGHDARDYEAYVTFGQAMVVQTVPSGCAATTNPPPLPEWQIPTGLPASAAVYRCARGRIRPGETELFDFQVLKNTAASFDDDLTFRADVIGEITLTSGAPLWFPTPTNRTDGITPRANDYTVDALRARVVGYNLTKDQVGVCTENNPPPATPDLEVQIGEECSFHVESGGWFGFQTPGFTYIAVQNIQVVDQLPDGQGYISSTDPLLTSTPAIRGVSLNPPPAPLDEGNFDWTFNTVVPAERITEKDHWFRADVTSRLLNDPLDTSAAPNQHAAQSSNILTSTFEAVFFNPVTMLEEIYNLGPSTIGFPREAVRRIDLTVTEPNLIVTQEVCNETRYGAGPACSNFVPLADDGDAFDTYVWRVTVQNEAASGGVTRAPAYDVTVTTDADPSDQLFVDPLPGDGLDNDGDALIDGGDAAGEGTIVDNVPENGIPAQIIEAYTHSPALLQIDAGNSVVFYYRVDPDDDVAPLQALTNSAVATYDSLEGASGAQTAPLGLNGEIGGARQFTSQPGDATIQIIPVQVDPKQVLRTSNTPLAAAAPQPVSIGEEVEFELRTLIPVAQLRSFVIRDELPAELSCTHAPTIDLGAPPYDAAGFVPGGVFVPTCTDTEVIWNFGNQTVTTSPRADRRFDFGIQFIARVDNLAASQDGLVIRNGGASTVTTVTYVNEVGTPVVIPFGEATLLVQEPLLALTKAFSVADADAGDVPTVTITATNAGTATAYNPRILDDLSLLDLTYVGNVGGASPPTVDVVTFGPDQPLFSWAPGFAIAPGGSVSFTFEVSVDAVVEPLQMILNTIEADWTSLPAATTALNPTGTIGPDGSATGMRIGALPNAGDALNDYEATIDATLPVPAVTVTKTDLDPALLPEIGAHKPFEVVIELPEGVSGQVSASDDLATGAVSYVLADTAAFPISYVFEGIATINGLAPDPTAFTAVPADGTSGTAVWTIGDVVTLSEDDLAVQAITPRIRIRYHGRINNDLVTDDGDTLQNTVQVDHRDGATGGVASVSDNTAAITALEPALTATKVLTNVTAGKAAGDPPAFGDTLQYVVTIVNGGNATAYDVNVVDTLPIELALSAGFTPTAAINAAPVAGFVGAPAGAPLGPLVWGRNNGDDSLDIPPAGSLDLTYQVEVVTPSDNPDTIANNVWTDWTSLQGASVHERDGDGCPTITPPDDYCFGPAVAVGTAVPLPPPDLLKETTQATATIGEAFTYRITVPQTPYPIPMYDVRVSDDFAGSAADLRFLSVAKVSGSEAWVPVNTGTPTNLVIEDPTIGIDIPVGEQIVFDITVVLQDAAVNVDGLVFDNTVSFLYNRTDGDVTTQRPSTPATSAAMTVVEPDLTLTKTGPATMTVGTPATFSLDVHNVGTSTAWNATVRDLLPDLANGGMCDTPPGAVTAQVFASDGVTPVSPVLVQGTDYTSTFTPAPTCELVLAMLSAASAIGVDQHLIVSYDASLDVDTQNGVALTNVAGASEWFSTDGLDPQTVGDRRSYTRALTDGSVGTLDHEDAHTVNVALPSYLFEKTATNVTTGQSPATNASPGDTLRYQLRVENLTSLPLGNFTLRDEVDRLNDPAVFVPGSLTLVAVPAGADASNTDPLGGLRGTGVVDVRDLVFPGLNGTVIVEYEVTLAPVVANGTLATNQAELLVGSVPFAVSDDPNLNGQASSAVAGDEDPTRVQIDSAPVFQVEKISDDISGDPAVLLAGETLRYTITVKNVGDDNAVDATLRDDIPVNTSYVAGSTTLNGAPVADVGGLPPFASGLLLYAPEDPTPGAMRADPSATPNNVATLVFDVVVDPATLDGTVISNQAFVSAVAGGVVDQPSDDPGTPLADDPTRDVVGNAPLLFAAKSVVIGIDGGTAGQVDPGDTLHYTIVVTNSGAVPATAATLTDAVPANTSYVADSVLLNTLPVGQPDGGVFPLAAGVPISSSDLTPPLPGAGLGTLNPGQSAQVEFDLMVNAGVPPGTLISNQAVVGSVQVPTLLTDGDGNPATGPEPTVVVVGDGQQLAITKQVAVVGGGPALAGGELEYVVLVSNIGTVPATLVVITDDLDAPVAGQLAYVPGSATLDGAAAGVSVAGSVITADYSTGNGPLMPGGTTTLRFRATLDPGLAMGTNVTNTGVVTWNNPPQTASASVSIAVGGTPGVGVVNGSVWHDADFDDALGLGERALQGWTVTIRRNGQPLQTATTDAAGAYRIGGLPPNDTSGDVYELGFRAPGAGPNTASLGQTDSAFTDGPQLITNLVIPSGSNLQNLNLPIDPNGVVYESLQRNPIGGARLTLLDGPGGTPLPTSCFDDPTQQGQVTRSDGFYKFDLNFSSVACPSGGSYVIEVDAGSSYAAGVSQVIPPISDATTPALSVPACPGSVDDVIPAPAGFCEVQASELQPPPSVPPRSVGTNHHVHLLLDASQAPGSSQIFNNHIAVDLVLGGVLGISKTTPKIAVSRGELVPYEITVRNGLAVPLPDLTVVDRYPAGFRYVKGSARVDGRKLEPTESGRELTWSDVGVDAGSTRTVVLLLSVGAGVGDGKFVNRAQALSSLTGLPLSGEATATVRVVPDPTFACTDVTGKVFDDANRNGVQDPGEPGLAGVRLVTLRGLAATTDAHGRYHITCAATPSDQRGSNFFLKLDERTLPTGFRMSTRQTQAQRATPGKALKLNFSASIHRVVALDMADPVFEPGSTELRAQWRPRLELLLEELEKAPSTLRLSYLADVEDEKLVKRRLEAVKDEIAEAWKRRGGSYRLTIEPEVFWRRGAPPEKPTAKAGGRN